MRQRQVAADALVRRGVHVHNNAVDSDQATEQVRHAYPIHPVEGLGQGHRAEWAQLRGQVFGPQMQPVPRWRYPPAKANIAAGVDWAHRVNLRGATLSATPRDGAYDLVVAARITNPAHGPASFKWLVLRYHVGRQRYTFGSYVGIQVVATPTHCPGG